MEEIQYEAADRPRGDRRPCDATGAFIGKETKSYYSECVTVFEVFQTSSKRILNSDDGSSGASRHVALTLLQERRAAGLISTATVYAQNVTSEIRSENDANEGL